MLIKRTPVLFIFGGNTVIFTIMNLPQKPVAEIDLGSWVTW
jgi:hypothetical protein